MKPGDIVTTSAGNYVYRLVEPVPLGPGWALKAMNNNNSVKYTGEMWQVDVLFDASCKNTLGSTVTDVKNLVVFDAKQLGVLWLNINNLIYQCRQTWKEYGTEEEGQQKQT